MLFEILKKGTYNGIEIDDLMFSDIIETFPGRVPVVLGHDVTMWAQDSAPAAGIVESVTTFSDLMGGNVNFNATGQAAWDSGEYPNWSAGLRRELQNEGQDDQRWAFVLDHVALLGAFAPGIPNLQVHFSKNNNVEDKNKIFYFNKSLNVMGGKPVADKKTPESTAPAVIDSVRPTIDFEAQFKLQSEKTAALEKQMAEREAQFRAEKVATAKANFSSTASKIFPKEDIEKAVGAFSADISPEDLSVFAALMSAKVLVPLPGKKAAEFSAKSGLEIPEYKPSSVTPGGKLGGLL